MKLIYDFYQAYAITQEGRATEYLFDFRASAFTCGYMPMISRRQQQQGADKEGQQQQQRPVFVFVTAKNDVHVAFDLPNLVTGN